MSKIKLFCFPYAGGSSVVYRKWLKYMHESIELCPVELSGRGARSDSYVYETFQDIVDDAYLLIKDSLIDCKYAFFGHSMGAVIAYELYYKLKGMNINGPVHIFFSGRKAPGSLSYMATTYDLPDEEFKRYIINLGGTSEEVLELQGFSELYIPMLRKDVKLIEQHQYVPRTDVLDCDISVLSGSSDKLSAQDIHEWKKHTSKECRLYLFEGGHFFINDNRQNVIKAINNSLRCII